MMRKSILVIALMIAALPAVAQPEKPKPTAAVDKPKKVQVTPYGFVRNYFNYDSRNMYTVIGGEYDMLPYDANMSDGVDLNDVSQAHLLAISSRVGLRLSGPMLGNAATSGCIEGDFGGFGTTNTVMRIRLAYMQLDWRNENYTTNLLIGQDWHPLSGNIMPDVLGMAAGAPFRPHSRTPQVRLTYTLGNGLGASMAALYQLQYMYNGPQDTNIHVSTASTAFANKAIVPEMFFGLHYRKGKIYTQLGADVQTLRPRNFGADPLSGNTVRVDETLTSITPTFYFQYLDGKFGLKCRTMLARNTSHLNQLNGYAIVGANADGSYDYAPLNASISYLNISYGSKWKGNIFLGYMKNLGAGQDLYADAAGNNFIFMKGGEAFTHLNSLWRIAPSISFNLSYINLGLEYEMTAATYGDRASDGSILLNDNLRNIVNHRICMLARYNF